VNSDPAIIFLHLPKCGGTTLNRIIEWEYAPTQVFSVDPSFFRWSYHRLIQWPAQRLARMRVFKGHMPFGLHKLLPQPATYITILRDPVDRAVSEYYYALSRKIHPQHRTMKKLTLEDYIQTTRHNNVQTKLVAGLQNGYDFLAGECTEQTLAIAKENLARHFSVVAPAERFDEALALAKLTFNWRIQHYANFNVTRSRPRSDSIPLPTRELIAERYRFDLALYQHACSLFDQIAARHPERLSEELDSVRRAKALSSSQLLYYRVASAARKAICRLNSAI
jgi:galactose-3-O-sulfotransferase